jgi:rhodanese-related sulfurtransferase
VNRRLGLLAAAALLCALGAGCKSSMNEVFRRVRPQVAFELLRDNPETVILDLRTREAYSGPARHLAGARNYPLDQLEARRFELRFLSDQTFLVYCDTAECAEQGLQWFLDHGFKSAMLMDGGIDAWIAAGYGTSHRPMPALRGDEGVSDGLEIDDGGAR